MTSYEARTRRFSRAEYDRMIELGIFQPGEAIELIGGELMVAEPQGAAHCGVIRKTARALDAAFGPGWDVRTQGPIGLDDESEPEPDIAVVPGGPDDYMVDHPSRPVLTVEVAQSSLSFDRDRKASLYARAGLADYWASTSSSGCWRSIASPSRIPGRPSGGGTRAERCSMSLRR